MYSCRHKLSLLNDMLVIFISLGITYKPLDMLSVRVRILVRMWVGFHKSQNFKKAQVM